MKQFMAKNAAKAFEAVRECEEALRILLAENTKLLIAVSERRMAEMRVVDSNTNMKKSRSKGV